VDDRPFVRRFQSIGDLQRKIEQCCERQWATANFGLQGLAFQQLHGEKELAVLLANVSSLPARTSAAQETEIQQSIAINSGSSGVSRKHADKKSFDRRHSGPRFVSHLWANGYV